MMKDIKNPNNNSSSSSSWSFYFKGFLPNRQVYHPNPIEKLLCCGSAYEEQDKSIATSFGGKTADKGD